MLSLSYQCRFLCRCLLLLSLQLGNFLDITLNLANDSYKPYRKPNNEILYIHKESNHPPSITKHLPAAISRRIASLSSDKQAFDSVAHAYDNALKQSNYTTKLQYPIAEIPLPPKVDRKTRNANAHETLSGLTRHIVKTCKLTSPEIS